MSEKRNIVDLLVGRSVEAKNKKKDWNCLFCKTHHDGSERGAWGFQSSCNIDCATNYHGGKPVESESE